MTHDGYIKYEQHWEIAKPLTDIEPLVLMRNQLAALQWIGVYPDGVGYGNISLRLEGADQFLISGTQTGNMLIADASHFCMVEKADINKNILWCKGPIKASSEALTHAAFYQSDRNICAVIHIHDAAAWKRLLFAIPTVSKEIEYGTPEMAFAMQALIHSQQNKLCGVIVTAGHADGIFAYGDSLNSAFSVLESAMHHSPTNNG
ncbi:MAG TPA: class II aldolase/adducin family protein [Chitinophagales bacterium]|nr:class II aldolase/adducin family protein [Chitinophagales bacterium]HMX04008.1 class II aldolase/adducin family protein [Chitinophagales bacterium]HNA59137.1 class II aldolase/adducin family protein [Chitinophagales bacterium]HNE45773.1 class II aldolase/adducin family protein [Chitinophagales bacterium]HNI54390.1 class II aldolase/adducin family protein [Chitinophagales bacterium]